MTASLPPAQYIDDEERLGRLIDHLATESLLALDTESNSLYAYRERVCLIQLSTRTADYIIDPLALSAELLSPLGALLADPQIEKVFHAGEYDIICLKRDFGFAINNLFDTMIAARICGYPAIGLANLLSEYFEVKVDKRHQHDNWGARPLSDESLRYAQKDSHYLPALRDHLNRDLKRNGHLTEAHEIFEDATYVKDANHRAFDPDGFWRIGTPHSLTRQQMAILRELYLLRDRIARRRDLPVFKIFSNRVLVSVAEASPRSLKDLRSIRGMSPVQIRRYGKRILQAVERGRASPLPDPPRHQPPDPVVTERYAALHTWRKERAQQRGVESDVIVSKDTLWTLAHRVPTSLDEMQTIRGLGPWRMETYGPELLDVLMGAISE